MKKYILCSVLLLMSVARGWADVDVNVTATKFIATVNEIDFYNSTTGQWVTAGTGTETFDIASVGSGYTVGNYISGGESAQWDIYANTIDRSKKHADRSI